MAGKLSSSTRVHSFILLLKLMTHIITMRARNKELKWQMIILKEIHIIEELATFLYNKPKNIWFSARHSCTLHKRRSRLDFTMVSHMFWHEKLQHFQSWVQLLCLLRTFSCVTMEMFDAFVQWWNEEKEFSSQRLLLTLLWLDETWKLN